MDLTGSDRDPASENYFPEYTPAAGRNPFRAEADKAAEVDTSIPEIEVPTDLVSMTEAREIEISVEVPPGTEVSSLQWTFGRLNFSEWKQWQSETGKAWPAVIPGQKCFIVHQVPL